METKLSNKYDFRNYAKRIRENIDTKSCSIAIVSTLQNWELYKNAQNVMLFYPINSEVNLLDLLKDTTKNFYFPSLKRDEVEPVLYNKHKGFTKGKFSIQEPVGEIQIDYSILDIVLFPALACDKNGYRLGYGKGFYDRFSKKLTSNTIKALPVSTKLVFDCIPCEAHDERIDFLVTENYIKPIHH